MGKKITGYTVHHVDCGYETCYARGAANSGLPLFHGRTRAFVWKTAAGARSWIRAYRREKAEFDYEPLGVYRVFVRTP